jgi:hypothetical protein
LFTLANCELVQSRDDIADQRIELGIGDALPSCVNSCQGRRSCRAFRLLDTAIGRDTPDKIIHNGM